MSSTTRTVLGRRPRGSEALRRVPGAGEEGVALLIALLFIILLTVIVVEYAYENQVEASFVENSAHEFEAYMAAKSAVAVGMGLLAAEFDMKQQSGEELYDSFADAWARGVPYQAINGAVMQCAIEDECGKLNLNALFAAGSAEANPTLEETLRTLFQVRNAPDSVVDGILDWLDSGGDDGTRSAGAETDYYSTLEIPYACKDAPMDSLDELFLISGMTPEIYFGDPMLEQLPLDKLLTVHGDPAGKINVNTAAPELLDALGQAMGLDGLSRTIVEQREQSPFTGLEDLQSRAGIEIPQKKPGGKKPAAGGQDRAPKQARWQSRQPSAGGRLTGGGAGTGTSTGGGGSPGGGQAGGQGGGGSPGGEQEEASPQHLLTVTSRVFRIAGRGEMRDARVQVEAYVARGAAQGPMTGGESQNGNNPPRNDPRSPTNPRPGQTGLRGATQIQAPTNTVMILDWRVMQ